MAENITKKLPDLLPPERMQDVDHWIEKYPVDQRQSAVMAALRIAQEQLGHLSSEVMDAIADYLAMPAIAVYEVATFYTMYERTPCGKNIINVCTNISCKLKDSAQIVSYLEEKLGVTLGQTTEDKQFTLRAVECLGACVGAPMMQINKDYHEYLTPEKIDLILERYS